MLLGHDSAPAEAGLWAVGDAGDVVVEVESGTVEAGTCPHQQQRQQRRYRQRHRTGHAALQYQEQQPQPLGVAEQQPWQPIDHSWQYVQLLKQAALVHSWSGALRVLEQQQHLQQAHVGLLWWQLKPRLQARQHAAAAHGAAAAWDNRGSNDPHRTSSSCPPQRVRQVLHHLSNLTQQHVSSMSPQSLSYTLQGIASAIATGDVMLGGAAVQQSCLTEGSSGRGINSSSVTEPFVSEGLIRQLWGRLLEVANSCTAQQLARCLEGGKHLGWHLGTSSSPSVLCCWPILEAACSGLLVARVCSHQHHHQHVQQQRQDCACWSSSEAGELLVALAQLMTHRQDQHQPMQQHAAEHFQVDQHQHLHAKAWQQQHPAVHQLVQKLLVRACQLTAPPVSVTSLGQGVIYTYNPGGIDWFSRRSSVPQLCNPADVRHLQAAVAALQSAAVLGVLPDPQQLEQLVAMLEPHLGSLPPNQVLQALSALLQMHVEPWETWLKACLSSLESGMQLLSPEQLLQLLLLLPHVRTVQPSQQLLQGLAKLSAVHCCRYSWKQLAALPGGFVAVGHRPPAYWFKDYLAASTTCLQQRQQQELEQEQPAAGSKQQQLEIKQQQQGLHQHVEGVHHHIAALVGVSRLSPPPVPAAWLSAVEAQLITHLQQLQDMGPHSSRVAQDAAMAAAQALPAFKQWKYTPTQQLLSLLAVATSVDSRRQQQEADSADVFGPAAEAGALQHIVPEAAKRGECDGHTQDSSCSSSNTVEFDMVFRHPSRHGGDGPKHVQRQQQLATQQSWEIDFSSSFHEHLWGSATHQEYQAVESLVDKGWQLQRVCTNSGSRRLAAWGVCVQQESSALAIV